MKRITACGFILAFGSALYAQTVNVRGKVSNGAGQSVANAVLELMQQGLKDTTGADGSYALVKTGAPIRSAPAMPGESMRLDKGTLKLTVVEASPMEIEVFDAMGNLRKKEALPKAQPGVYHLDIASALHSNGMLIIKASIGTQVRTFRYFPLRKDISGGSPAVANANPANGMLAKIAAAADTLMVSADGYATKKIELSSYDTTVNVTLADAGPVGVPKVTPQNATSVPSSYAKSIATPGKVTDKTYSAYYYNNNGAPEDIFKAPVKQSAAITKPVKIYTPPGYDPQKQYPYIIVMHGFDSYEYRWFDLANPKLEDLFDNLISSGVTKPFIAVYPRGSQDVSNANGFYSFGGEMMNDLIPFLEANYSLKKDRASRAMAGFSFGGMQSITIGLCAHLKEFAWIAGFDAGGPGTSNADDIAKYLEAQNAKAYPVYYFYLSAGTNDAGAVSSVEAFSKALPAKTPYLTSANFSVQSNIVGPGNGSHNYPTAEVGLYNFLRMAFSPEY
jgi:enterochelin esterase-like enzyme